MILPSQRIRELKILFPFREKYKVGEISGGLSCASYDVALDQDVIVGPKNWTLASTEEHFTMPSFVAAVVHDKSSWARCGLSVLNTFIDPGWRGFLTLELFNHSDYSIDLAKGTPVAQIVFYNMWDEPEIVYNGKYQDQKKGITKPII